MPSVRNLARDLNCSVITTRKAYEGAGGGGVYNQYGGEGVFVAPQNMELLRENRLAEIERKLTDIMEYARPVGITGADLKTIIDELSRED